MSLFKKKKALVAGDFMLDFYTFGEVARISPEAPVPIVRIVENRKHPGGAGNALLNMVSMELETVAFGRVGEDKEGDYVLEAFSNEGIDCSGIFRDPTYQTPLKNRIIAGGQQLLRIDRESFTPLNPALESKIVAELPKLLQNVGVVAISDYAKGFLTPTLLTQLIQHAKQVDIPVIVDPKGRDFARYQNATLLKPNLSEAIDAAGLPAYASLDEVAQYILKKINVETLMITRSKEGITLFDRKWGRRDFPTEQYDVKDVTGAGDTVLAVIAAAMANKIDLGYASQLANIAAGMVIKQVGCVRISLAKLMQQPLSKLTES